MTIASTARKAGPLLGNGAATTFPFAFKVFAEGDIKVVTAGADGVETVRVLGSDYSVSINANQDTAPGGTVTYPISGVPLASGSVLSVIGDLDYDQPLDLPSGGNFSPLALENQLDRTVMQVQQLHEEMGRTAKLPVTSLADADSLVADIVRLADSVDNIDTVAGSIAGVDTVASNIADVNTVAAVEGAVAATGANIAAVVAVGNDLLEPVSEINTVATDMVNVNTVGANIAGVNTVAGIAANVAAVAGNAEAINTVATNVADVTNFADVYQGAKAVNPTLRNDGSALQSGDLYFNTTENALRAYSGSVWVAGTAGSVAVQNFSGDGVTTTFTLATAPASENNTQVYLSGVYQQKDQYSVSGTTLIFSSAPPAGGNNIEVVTLSSLSLGETDAALVAFVPAGTGAVERTVQSKLRDVVNVLDFGADPTGTVFSTSAIQTAVQALRANPKTILDTIGGSSITAYSSGTVEFPRGVFKIAPDTLKIYQDLGLKLKGQGSRRTNNAVRAATTLLISGTSSGFGVQAYRSGGRGLTIEDMDICYETSGFTGDVLDVVDCPGVTLKRVFLGTYIANNGSRLQTARSVIRSTYDEFMHFTDCVFDGAVDGWWSDDTRTELGNTFGGSLTMFDNCVWYDFTGSMIRHDGNRTRVSVVLNVCAFNPISVDCVRSVDLNNVDGLVINGGGLGGSVANKASTEWMRLINVTGRLNGVSFDDNAKAGTIGGMLDVSGCRIYCTDGFTVRSGVVTGKSNEFGKGTNGYVIAPTSQLTVDLGPDLFKNQVTTSYYVPADSALLSGRINYDYQQDASTSFFSNASGRVTVENIGRESSSVPDAAFSVSRLLSGKLITATGSSAQTFTLQTSTPGTRFLIHKLSNATLTVNCASGNNFYRGSTSTPTSATISTAGELGSTIELVALGTAGWIVVGQTGSWSYA